MEKCPHPTKRDSDVQAGKLKEAQREAARFKLILDAFRSRARRRGMPMRLYEIFVIYNLARTRSSFRRSQWKCTRCNDPAPKKSLFRTVEIIYWLRSARPGYRVEARGNSLRG